MITPASNFTQKYNFECKTSDQASENIQSSNKTFLKNNFLNPSNDHGYFCACIECKPIGNDHENFMADMPDDPAEIISDFSRMGLIKNAKMKLMKLLMLFQLQK